MLLTFFFVIYLSFLFIILVSSLCDIQRLILGLVEFCFLCSCLAVSIRVVMMNCILGVGGTLLVPMLMCTALLRSELELVPHLPLDLFRELLSTGKILSQVSRAFQTNVSLRYSDAFQVAKREAQVPVYLKGGLCL